MEMTRPRQGFSTSNSFSLFKRCVQCPAVSPSCPTCSSSEICSLVPQSCGACASTSCVPQSQLGSTPSPPATATAAGPVAGGVIGGVAVIALATYSVWRFCIKKRRQMIDENEWPDSAAGSEKGTDQFSISRQNRASTHTVGSVASTVYTRASNIIQIAYIPGVTNRSTQLSTDFVPPVPPIPAASARSSPAMGSDDQHYFLPLRESTYSRTSDRSAARSSVATTIYQSNVVVNPVPAQTVTRAKAVPVSVKSSSKSSPDLSRPSTRSSDASSPRRPTAANLIQANSSIVARAAHPKQVLLTRSASNLRTQTSIDQIHELSADEASRRSSVVPQRSATASPGHTGNVSTLDGASSDEDDGATSPAALSELDATAPLHSHFSPSTSLSDTEPSTPGSRERASRKGSLHTGKSLNKIIEEATRKAAEGPILERSGSYRDDGSPFSDAHATE